MRVSEREVRVRKLTILANAYWSLPLVFDDMHIYLCVDRSVCLSVCLSFVLDTCFDAGLREGLDLQILEVSLSVLIFGAYMSACVMRAYTLIHTYTHTNICTHARANKHTHVPGRRGNAVHRVLGEGRLWNSCAPW